MIFSNDPNQSAALVQSLFDGVADGSDTNADEYLSELHIWYADIASSSPSVMVTILPEPAFQWFIPKSSSDLRLVALNSFWKKSSLYTT